MLYWVYVDEPEQELAVKNLVTLGFLLLVVSCGKSSDNKSDSPSGNQHHEQEIVSDKNAFVLQSADSEETFNAVFYDAQDKIIVPPANRKANPKNYPFGAKSAKIYTKKTLDKALIFTCCGNLIKDIKIEKEVEGVWKVSGFFVNIKDAKSPMVFIVDGKDYFLNSPLKHGLIGIRKDFKDAVGELSDELSLSEEQVQVLKDRVNKILMDNLNFKMDSHKS